MAERIARTSPQRDQSRPYSGRSAVMPLCVWLVVLFLAGCNSSTPTNTPVAFPADLPAYPSISGAVATLGRSAFPQEAQYDQVQAFTFNSPDSAATISGWYKDQLTAKGWQIVASGPTFIGLTTADRNKLIEIFLAASSSSAASTKVIAYYASGRRLTPTP